jgi:hypothetical protein
LATQPKALSQPELPISALLTLGHNWVELASKKSRIIQTDSDARGWDGKNMTFFHYPLV